MDDRVARALLEDNILIRQKRTEADVALLQKLSTISSVVLQTIPVPGATSGNDMILGAGIAGRVAEFVGDPKHLQAAALIAPTTNILTLTNAAEATLALNITATKTLTLTAANNYDLTIPATGTVALLGTANVFTTTQMVDSAADAIELRLQAHSTKTTAFLTFENSSGTVLSRVEKDGSFYYGGTYDANTRVQVINTITELTSGDKPTVFIRTAHSTNAGASAATVQGLYWFTSMTGSNNHTGSLIGIRGFSIASLDAGKTASIVAGLQSYGRGSGAGTATLVMGMYSLPEARDTASVGLLEGLRVAGSVNDTATVTTFYGIHINTPTKAAGATLTNAYGLYIEAINTAGTLNYAIYTNAGLVHFGDSLDLASGKNITLIAGNIVTDTTTGTKIGTATSQKLSLWNATPIIQPTTGIAAATFVANTSGLVDDSATFDGYTLGQIVKALRNIGALA